MKHLKIYEEYRGPEFEDALNELMLIHRDQLKTEPDVWDGVLEESMFDDIGSDAAYYFHDEMGGKHPQLISLWDELQEGKKIKHYYGDDKEGTTDGASLMELNGQRYVYAHLNLGMSPMSWYLIPLDHNL